MSRSRFETRNYGILDAGGPAGVGLETRQTREQKLKTWPDFVQLSGFQVSTVQYSSVVYGKSRVIARSLSVCVSQDGNLLDWDG